MQVNRLLEPIEFLDIHPLIKSEDLDLMLPRKGIILKSFFCSPQEGMGSPHQVFLDRGGNREATAPWALNPSGLCQEILS